MVFALMVFAPLLFARFGRVSLGSVLKCPKFRATAAAI
jgi:hypothetical protein